MPANYLLTYIKKEYYVEWMQLPEEEQKPIKEKVQKYLENQIKRHLKKKKNREDS